MLDPSCPFSSPVFSFGVVVFLSVTSLSTVHHASSSLPKEGRERDLMLSRSATTRSRPQRILTGRGYFRTGSFADAERPRVPLSVSLCFSRDGMTPSFSSTVPSCLFYLLTRGALSVVVRLVLSLLIACTRCRGYVQDGACAPGGVKRLRFTEKLLLLTPNASVARKYFLLRHAWVAVEFLEKWLLCQG